MPQNNEEKLIYVEEVIRQLPSASAGVLASMINTFIPDDDRLNSIFICPAKNLIRAVTGALVELRDSGEIQLSALALRNYLTLPKIIELAERADLSDKTTKDIRSFLRSIGWQEGRDAKSQAKSLSEQFGYALGYFSEFLSIATDESAKAKETVNNQNKKDIELAPVIIDSTDVNKPVNHQETVNATK